MQPRGLAWITALALAIALVPTGAAEDAAAPVLVEAQPNPDGTDRGNEWLELHNPTPAPLSLDPFYVNDHDFCFAEDTRYDLSGTIAPMDRVVVTLPGSCILLENSGDRLTLETEDGHVVQTLQYGPGTDLQAPSGGDSLTACQAGATHLQWMTAEPTRGEANPFCGPL